MEKNQQPEIHFRFVDIQIGSKILYPKPTEDYDGKEFQFDFRIELRVSPQKKAIICFQTITVKEVGKNKLLASFELACVFEIDNFEEGLKQDIHGKFQIPPDLDLTIKSASVSTARGVIYSEFRGTYLDKAIMPIIDINSLLPDDVKKALGTLNK